MSKWFAVPTGTSFVLKFTELITRTGFLPLTAILKLPFASDGTPLLVPFTSTEAFARGAPLLSFIVPVIVLSCANVIIAHKEKNEKSNSFFVNFFIAFVFFFKRLGLFIIMFFFD